MSKNTFKKTKETRVSISELMSPSTANYSGKVHGGYLLKLMDQIAYACASKHSGTYCVTASVDTVDFLQAVEVGELLTLKASINYVGKTSMVVGIRVESQNIRTGKVKHCNSSYFTMVAKYEDSSQRVPGIILKNKKEIRRFFEAIKRLEIKKNRKKEFTRNDFDADNYIEVLKDYNVKIDFKK